MRGCYCGSDAKIPLHDLQLVLPDDCNLNPYVRIVQCSSCGFVYSDTNLIQKDYDEYYASQDYYSQPMNDFSSHVTDVFEFSKEYLGSSVLDVGCGGGQLLRFLKTKGLKVHGIDTSKPCVDGLLQDGIQCTHGSIFTISPSEKYDCVTCTHVLEHVLDVNGFVKRLCEFVDKNLYIEVPDSSYYATYPPFQDFNTEHVNHFTLGTLVRLFEMNGMRCVKSWSEKEIFGNYGICCMFTKEPLGMSKYITESGDKLKAILESIPRDEPLCLYGAGQFTFKLMSLLPNVKYIVDDRKCRQGKTIGGIVVTDKPPEGIRVLKTF
jgi:SAM-dependent methyltransferase